MDTVGQHIFVYIYMHMYLYNSIYINICEAITQNRAFAQFKHEISALLTGGKSQQLGINGITWDN